MLSDRDGVTVGVAGCGYWGSKHVRALRATPGVADVVLIDSQQQRTEALLRSHPGARCFASLDDALPHVDAVVIATPATSHVTLALSALAAGKHVLVEKPLATSSAGARQLIDAAAEAGVVLMVGHTFEYNAAVWKLRELVESRELGELYYVDSARLNLGLYQADVNVIFDLAPHDISIINFVLGARPTGVQATAFRHADRRFEDVAYLQLFYDELGVTANVHVSWLDPAKVRRTTVVGSKKMAVYNDMAAEERIRVHDKGVVLDESDGIDNLRMSYRYGDVTAPFIAFDEPLAIEDRHFVECIETGATPRTDGQNGLGVVQVLECAELSLRADRRVDLVEVGGSIPLQLDTPLDDSTVAPAVALVEVAP
jgi:predicted dehydrogenase